MKKLILTLILILLVSGCTGMPDLFGLFPQKTEVKEKPPDVIVIQNVNVLPPPPINAGDQFSVSFELSNQEEERDVNVEYKLLDDGLCWTTSTTSDSIENFVPGQVEFIEWTFDTPSADEIAYISTKCPIRFNVNYKFEAISEIEANVITNTRYYQLQQSGEFKTFTPTLTVGRGPIKIYMEFGASLPIQNDSTLPVYVTVEDKGTGLLLTKIPTGDLKIEVPPGFDSEGCGDRFTCSGSECWNTVNISMIKRKSPTFRCSFTTPSAGTGLNEVSLEKTYFISAHLNYTYDVTNQVDVEVKPLSV
jgi:hypothetical protein